MRRFYRSGILFVAALSAQTARAEVLPVSGVDPALSDAAIDIESIAVSAIEGSQGGAQGFELRDKLRDAQVDGEAWFAVVDADDPKAQAVLSGSVSHASVRDQIDDKEVESCIEKDGDGKCLRKRTTFVPCSKLTVRLYPELVLRTSDGEEVWNYDSRVSDTEEYCEDESSRPTTSGMLDSLNSTLAWQIRRQLAPRDRSLEVRILERRKGLQKPDRGLFKDAVRMTKSDALSACMAFQNLEANNPQHPSLLFNLGVCQEGTGDLDRAQAYYLQVQDILGEKSYIDSALRRVASFKEGQAQIAARQAQIAEETDSLGDSAS